MKQFTLILATTILGLKAFATPVPADKLQSYKEAVSLALAQQPLSCTFTPAGDEFVEHASLAAIINQADSADLNDSGAQPVLVFKYTAGPGGWDQTTSVTTSDDYESIVFVKFSQFVIVMKDVNLGTIENPKIISETSLENPISAICR